MDFKKILEDSGLDPAKLSILEIGCGGGLLTEEFARLGCHLTGIDPSGASISAARQHAIREGLGIDFLVGTGEKLPFGEGSFDVVVCCDVLEHVDDVKIVVTEGVGVLKHSGLFFYDTLNRTLRSWFETILVGQDIPLTRVFAPRTHAWEQFIRPGELLAIYDEVGLVNRGMSGLRPGIATPLVALELLRRGLGRIDYAELGRRLKFKAEGGVENSYVGYAIKK